MRVAIVHDWLTGMRGGEKVLRSICRCFPHADLLTLLHVPGSCCDEIERMRIRTSWLDDLPAVERYYRNLLPAMPQAIEAFEAGQYDLVLSSSHCVAKGVLRRPGTLHICYCHSPMRYVWSQDVAYHRTMGLKGVPLRLIRGYLRAWDRRSATHVDHFIANSANVAGRIARTYGREAEVVYPPIDTDFLSPADVEREAFYLMVSAMAPYKRVDHAIEAFASLGTPLVVIGSGQQYNKLRRLAPVNVKLIGWQDDKVVRDHYRRCRALIFPGEEDFGMVPLEAMACGAPVIAYGAGGALETVRCINTVSSRPTGLCYRPQTTQALVEAVVEFERRASQYDHDHIVQWAQGFGEHVFDENYRRVVNRLLAERGMGEQCR